MNSDSISPWRLRVFLEVAASLSFSRAAATLYVSQPTVSRYVKELEESVGQPLFDRTGGRVTLTQAGLVTLEHAKKIIGAIEDMIDALSEIPALVGGELRLGATCGWGYLLADPVAEFHRAYPQVFITILGGTADHIVDLVLSRRVHLGFVAERPLATGIEVVTVFQDDVVVVAAPEHPLATLSAVEYTRLDGLPFVVYVEGTDMSNTTYRLLGDSPITGITALKVGTLEAALSAVRQGVGLSLMLRCVADHEIRTGCIRALKMSGPPHRWPMYVIRNESRPFPATQSAFVNFLCSRLNRDRRPEDDRERVVVDPSLS